MTAASRPPVPDPTDPDGFSRRAFLTRSAAGGAGVLLAGGVTGCSAPRPPSPARRRAAPATAPW